MAALGLRCLAQVGDSPPGGNDVSHYGWAALSVLVPRREATGSSAETRKSSSTSLSTQVPT